MLLLPSLNCRTYCILVICLDFGRGFYLTIFREQAEKYAERFLRRGNEAYINIYEVCGDLSGFKKKSLRLIMKSG